MFLSIAFVPVARGAMADARLLLRGRLGASRLALEGKEATPCFSAVSRAQCNSILELMGRHGSSLTPDERASLLDIAIQVPFAPTDAQLVTTSIAGPPVVAGSDRRRSQEFLAMVYFIDRTRWDSLLSDQVNIIAKEDILISLFRALGLQIPNELTFKRLASIIMMLGDEWSNLSVRSVAEKKKDLELLKKKWHVGSRKIPMVDPFIQNFPSLPADFRALYPGLWSAAYGDGDGPVTPPPIDERKLNLLDASFKARGCGEATQGPTLNLRPSASTEQLPNALVPMGNIMMQCMQQMATQQQKMMEMMVLGGVSPQQGRQPAGLRALMEAASPRGHALSIQDRSPAVPLADSLSPSLGAAGDSPPSAVAAAAAATAAAEEAAKADVARKAVASRALEAAAAAAAAAQAAAAKEEKVTTVAIVPKKAAEARDKQTYFLTTWDRIGRGLIPPNPITRVQKQFCFTRLSTLMTMCR